MFSEIVTNKYFLLATHLPKNIIFRKNQVLHIADINVWEIYYAYIIVCWSSENGKNLPAFLNLTENIIVVHPYWTTVIYV